MKVAFTIPPGHVAHVRHRADRSVIVEMPRFIPHSGVANDRLPTADNDTGEGARA